MEAIQTWHIPGTNLQVTCTRTEFRRHVARYHGKVAVPLAERSEELRQWNDPASRRRQHSGS